VRSQEGLHLTQMLHEVETFLAAHLAVKN